MGRVARYKKIKACDPYSKQNGGRVQLDKVGVWGLGDNGRKPKKRSKTAERLRAHKRKRQVDEGDPFDLPPEGEDEFDMADLLGSVKREKKTTEETEVVSNVVKTVTTSSVKPEKALKEDENLQSSKLLKLDKQIEKKLHEAPEVKRMPGESKKAFDRRIKAETRMIIREQRVNNRNPEKKQRKKEFLTNKKKKKSGEALVSSSSGKYADDSDAGADDDFITGEQAAAHRDRESTVPFGVQAERPPSFKQLPRGAVEKKRPTGQSKLSDDADIEAEKKTMELMRRKIQAQYAAIKAQRRQRGDFHL
ncbi:hypothetical protein FisN_12Lu389 [Fistulifera solaris]|uniref:Uncharacterized protein n=1 Tax=Fistulifera solaris TaxID=1519565 RepID=A0A1Z5JM51_FISSO|nr:hypothetical protein FisN_12Lu389 [Fistulifera solaris]|eukprot:GAX15049.1 hypothetical protein FisN_12Lu389 [Fistulifera solaris]